MGESKIYANHVFRCRDAQRAPICTGQVWIGTRDLRRCRREARANRPISAALFCSCRRD